MNTTYRKLCRMTVVASMLTSGCGDTSEPQFDTVTFEAPVSYTHDEFDWDVGCPEVDCPPTGFCDRVTTGPPLVFLEEPPPIAAGTTVLGFLDLPRNVACELEATIRTEDTLCVGRGTRPAGVEPSVVTIEFDCEVR